MALGIFLGLVGSIGINLGNNTQALAMGMAEKQKAQVDSGLTPSKRPKRIWAAGTAIFIIGSAINFVAFAFAAAAVLAPLEAVQFVTNLIFARFVAKTTVSRKMVAGSALIVGGTVGAVASGPMAVYSFSTAQLRGFWRSPLWIGYVLFAWSTSLGMQAFWHAETRRVRAGGAACGPPALMPTLYAISSALIGTQSVVQAKALSELIELWLSGAEAIWSSGFTYAVLGYFAVTVGFWLYRLNAALGKYDPLFIIPQLQASYIVLATLAGGIYFQEFQSLTWWQLLAFAGSIGVLFVGLRMLMPKMGDKSLGPSPPTQPQLSQPSPPGQEGEMPMLEIDDDGELPGRPPPVAVDGGAHDLTHEMSPLRLFENGVARAPAPSSSSSAAAGRGAQGFVEYEVAVGSIRRLGATPVSERAGGGGGDGGGGGGDQGGVVRTPTKRPPRGMTPPRRGMTPPAASPLRSPFHIPVWTTPSGDGFFRVAHGVSFATTEAYARATPRDGTPSIYDGAGAGIVLASPAHRAAHSSPATPQSRHNAAPAQSPVAPAPPTAQTPPPAAREQQPGRGKPSQEQILRASRAANHGGEPPAEGADEAVGDSPPEERAWRQKRKPNRGGPVEGSASSGQEDRV